MKHQVSNIGPNEIKVIDKDGEMHTVVPGAFWIGEVRTVYHGEKRAEYSVVPFDEK